LNDKTFSLPLAAQLPPLSLDFTGDDDNVAASVTCSSCYTTGSLDFVVDVDWDLSNGLTGTITMTPNDLAAYITVDVSVGYEYGDGVELSKEIFSYVPFGIDIPSVATIGKHTAGQKGYSRLHGCALMSHKSRRCLWAILEKTSCPNTVQFVGT
jgi:hypothetical protein